MTRDAALLPGPTAAQWNRRALLVLATGLGLLFLDLILIGVRVPATPLFFGVLAAISLAGFVGWIALGGIAQRRMRDELTAGYSTVVDAEGYDLRHPVTGALERDRLQSPDDTRPGRRSFLLGNLRIRKNTWVDRQRGPEDE